MNKRLKELYIQAHSIRRYDGDPALDGNPPTVYWQDEVSAERFAKLIVRECIQNIRDNMKIAKVDTLGDKDLFLETLRTSGHFYITELEQHFGVEE